MNRYFVVFHAESNGEFPSNDVIEYSKELTDSNDIRGIEKKISDIWFGDGREVVLINFKQI